MAISNTNFKVGDRVVVVHDMRAPGKSHLYDPIPVGMKGTITNVENRIDKGDYQLIKVDWDVPPSFSYSEEGMYADRFELLPDPAQGYTPSTDTKQSRKIDYLDITKEIVGG